MGIKRRHESRFLIFKAWQRRYKNVAERLPSFSFISFRNWVFPTKSDYLIRLNNEFCRSNNINLKFKKVYTIRLQKIYGLENFSLWARLNFIYVLKQVFFLLYFAFLNMGFQNKFVKIIDVLTRNNNFRLKVVYIPWVMYYFNKIYIFFKFVCF